jgi:alginate O-acetyltransferase complex protein AlgI
MLFNSYQFLFAFLPITLFGYFLAGKVGPTASIAWLVLCSIAFYAYWNPPFVLLILLSIIFNYGMGELISGSRSANTKRAAFWAAIAVNLLVLGCFKYLAPLLNFFADRGAFRESFHLNIILPLGISFFTFTQIGYLVDRRDNVGERLDPLRYSFFVTFFPHLIAGPILHVREIGAQLKNSMTFKLRAETFSPGLALFAIGLAKKILIADPLAPLVHVGYQQPELLSFAAAWMVIIGYSVQLYFDFSGYCDMAIGLAGMFGFRFPLNFNSPYKSRSAIEFWQRWHMTLSRYLALLLYNPLAMWVTRRRVAQGKGVSPKAQTTPAAFASMIALPTFYAMALAGIWHGAGLQFLVFGLLHACYLTINHAWRLYRKTHGGGRQEDAGFFSNAWKTALTYSAVVISFVFFRSESIPNALAMLHSATGVHGLGIPAPLALFFQDKFGVHVTGFLLNTQMVDNLLRIIVSLALIWFAPNSQQILGQFAPVLENVTPARWAWLRWRPSLASAIAISLLLWLSVLCFNHSTTFLYYQF